MRKSKLVVITALLTIALSITCVFAILAVDIITTNSSIGLKAEAKSNKTPFKTYEIKDSDGCEYLVVYESVGSNIAVAVTPQIKQSKIACLK